MRSSFSLTRLKGRLMNLHVPSDKPPIFVFSAPRSGSTYLIELLALEPGLKIYNEPLSIRKATTAHELGASGWCEATTLENRETVYKDYFDKLLANKIPEMNTPVYRRRGRFFTNRVAFKILHGGEDMVAWFAKTFGAQIVVLLRHPVPTAISHKQFPRLPYMLDQPGIRSRLTGKQIELTQGIIRNGSHLEKGAVDWCLQYVFLLGENHCPEWVYLSYEDLVSRPLESIDLLCRSLSLTAGDAMASTIDRPSLSTKQSDQDVRDMLQNLPHEGLNERKRLLARWKSKISEAEERQVFSILDAFGIDFYEFGNTVPAERYRIPEASGAAAR